MFVLFLTPHFACAKEIEKFYLNPSSENLNIIVSNFPETKDNHIEQSKLIFLTYALRAHPSYANILINNFNQYSSSQKNTVLNALYINQGKEIFNKLNMAEINYPSTFSFEMIENTHLNYPKNMKQVKEQCKKLDHLWGAFFATGDAKYVNIMKKYMQTENNESVKECAAEQLNRDGLKIFLSSIKMLNKEINEIFEPKDLVIKLMKEDPNNKQYLVFRFFFYTTLWWSLQANHQVPPMKLRIETE